MNTISVDTIEADSSLLAQVIELADENTATLGFLPRQAFSEHASKRLILAAVNSSGNLAGYLLYRIVRRRHRIAIVHLCVDAGYRGQGISKQLFDALVERSRGYRGIVLLCRRDFETANRLWKRLKFRPRSEKPGRGTGDTTLTEWWYDFGGTTLFDYAAVDKQQVIIDANIFFAFQDSKTAVPETLALQADWLNDEIELKVTPEIFHEVNRQENERLRKKHLNAANTYRVAHDPNNKIDETTKVLQAYLPTKKLPNDLSDITHLAWSICDPDVSIFVT